MISKYLTHLVEAHSQRLAIERARAAAAEARAADLEIRCRQLYDEVQTMTAVSSPDAADQLTRAQARVEALEAALSSVLRAARGDGREATSHEWQATMRTAQAILDER